VLDDRQRLGRVSVYMTEYFDSTILTVPSNTGSVLSRSRQPSGMSAFKLRQITTWAPSTTIGGTTVA
jgi:hypothetical protein